jgi:N-acetylmuramate 1-kinase
VTRSIDDSALHLTVDLPDEAATAAFAEDVALCLAVGDVVALSGDLGAGKTTFARALLRALTDDPDLEVPSPTFTLVQAYAGRLNVAHFDFYRLSGSDELDEIGFADAAAEGAVVVEWPERAGGRLPAERLTIAFDIVGGGRRAVVTGAGPLAGRFRRSRAARGFLDRSGWSGATRRHLEGDASTRTFERLRRNTHHAVLMDWLPGSQLPEGDPRAPYRARDARAFLAVDEALRGIGISAPEIYAADVAAGFVVMEDLGGKSVVVDGVPDAGRYDAVIGALAVIHAEPRPTALPLPDGAMHRLPHLGEGALLAEIGNYIDWYVPHVTGMPLPDTAKVEFAAIWSDLASRLAAAAEASWVLFDLQSPNLFWLPEREGIARIGVIDFQDMFHGAGAYDVASLCQDARVTIPAALEASLRERYVALRLASDSDFDTAAFRTAYSIAAASRATKNLGAFARLASSGKPSYVNHLPRTREYLARALADPVLSPLAVWYENNLIP